MVTVTSLGAIADNQPATIQAAVLAKNSAAAAGDFSVGSITSTGATLTGTPGKYQGTVPVTFTITPKQLSTVLTVTALGELANNTAPTIKAAAITKNSATGLTDAMFDITGTPTTTGATATGKGEYTGTVPVTFTVTP